MDTFYITPDEFWIRFNSEEAEQIPTTKRARLKGPENSWPESYKTESGLYETVPKSGIRYIIMYGRHKPGKKTKTWECDGYLSLVGQMAYVTDMRGRLLEEPTLLLPEDYDAVKDLGEILVGKTEVQVVEEDRGE